MSASFEILLPQGGHAVPVGETPLSVGRGPNNDVVLQDDTVSWHHAQLWVEGGSAWLRDLGSRNGTWRNGARVHGSTRLDGGDRIRLGATLEVELRGQGRSDVCWRTRHVDDLSSGVRLLVRSDRFTIGGGAACDLRVEDWPDRTATVMLHDNGEIWVGTSDGERQVEPNEVFEVQGRRLRVVEEAVDHAPTVEWGAHRYPYAVTGTGNTPDGPQVVVDDPVTGAQCLVMGNRGVLLYVLARKLEADRGACAERSEEGWCTTDEVVTGIWGRGRKTANHLNVLVHRLRGQLEEKGFDPWFVEKRRGGIRIRCRTVEVH